MSREPLTLPRTADVRRLLVAEEDVAAARRLLSALAPSGADDAEDQEQRPDAQEVRQRAHIELALANAECRFSKKASRQKPRSHCWWGSTSPKGMNRSQT